MPEAKIVPQGMLEKTTSLEFSYLVKNIPGNYHVKIKGIEIIKKKDEEEITTSSSITFLLDKCGKAIFNCIPKCGNINEITNESDNNQ